MDRRKFWKEKWIKEHRIGFAITFLLTVAIVLLFKSKQLIEMSTAGWVIIFLILVVVDLVHFNRQMNIYVNDHLREEEEKGLSRDGFSIIDEDDPRIVDVDDRE